MEATVENLTYKFSEQSNQFILSCIYDAPAVGVKKFITDTETILSALNEYLELSCNAGDMDIDLLKDTPERKQYMSIVHGNGLAQLMNEPTRIADKNKTLHDQVLITKCDEGIVSSGVITTAITFHSAAYGDYLYCATFFYVKKVIDNLEAHKSAGSDGIPADVIKNCSHTFAPLLTNLINLSVPQGTFPSCFRTASVIPIYKGNDRTDMNNYRTISLLSVVSKVFERILYLRNKDFLEMFHLLNDS